MAPTDGTVPTVSDGGDYPENWIFDEHGETIAGTFLRFERGQTKNYGAKPIAVLEVHGAERSLWLNTAVLQGKFRDELEQRPQRELVPGERIVVKRLGKATTEDGREYWSYRVLFPDRPSLSTSDLFDFEGEPPRQEPQQQPKPDEPTPATATATAQDDDDGIPF